MVLEPCRWNWNCNGTAMLHLLISFTIRRRATKRGNLGLGNLTHKDTWAFKHGATWHNFIICFSWTAMTIKLGRVAGFFIMGRPPPLPSPFPISQKMTKSPHQSPFQPNFNPIPIKVLVPFIVTLNEILMSWRTKGLKGLQGVRN